MMAAIEGFAAIAHIADKQASTETAIAPSSQRRQRGITACITNAGRRRRRSWGIVG